MRKFLKIIMKVIICLAIVLNIGSMPVFADEIISGTSVSWSFEYGVLTISGTGAMADCSSEIPWSSQRPLIEKIVIKDGVTHIGNRAFAACVNASSIEIASSVKTIGESAFGACKTLDTVNIPCSVETIGNSAFYNCTSLANITLAEGLKTIGDGAFNKCGSKNIVIPASVTSVGINAFSAGKFETIYNLSKTVLKDSDYSSISVYSPLSVVEGVNITCGETQSYNGNTLYKAGSQVTLTPKNNMKISNVTVNNEVIEASWGIYSFTMPAGATSVAFTLTEGGPVTYRGAQMRANADNTYDISFIATVATLDKDAVGFVLSKSETNPTKETAKTKIISNTIVYNSITAMDSTIIAKNVGGTYIIACTIKSIPQTQSSIPIYISAFATKGTETTYTEVHTVTVSGLK